MHVASRVLANSYFYAAPLELSAAELPSQHTREPLDGSAELGLLIADRRPDLGPQAVRLSRTLLLVLPAIGSRGGLPAEGLQSVARRKAMRWPRFPPIT